MLVVAGAKPVSISLRDHGSWSDLPAVTFRHLRVAGYTVRRFVDVHEVDTMIVAGRAADAAAAAEALAEWSLVRDLPGHRADNATRLGRILGYPERSIAAFASYDPAVGGMLEDDPPWDPDLLAWWDAFDCFRLPDDPDGIAEARAWLETAIERFRATFPDAQVPTRG